MPNDPRKPATREPNARERGVPRRPVDGNLLRDLPSAPMSSELFETLLELECVRVERIVSTGQRSPEGFWYDQPDPEWVLLLQGGATLKFEDESSERVLSVGDWVLIPARCRHRVEATSESPPAVWLAVHPRSVPPSGDQ